MDLTRYNHLVWDWNGTLLEDVWLVVEVMNGLLERRGLDLLTESRYRGMFDFPVRDFYVALGFDLMRDPFERVAIEFIEAFEARRFECALRGGAREGIDCAARAGLTQHLLSATQHDSLVTYVRHYAIDTQFEHLLGLGDHFAASKVEVARQWIRDAAIDPATILLVGDTTHDGEVAEAIGADCLLVRNGHQSPERLAATGRPMIDHPAEICGVGCP